MGVLVAISSSACLIAVALVLSISPSITAQHNTNGGYYEIASPSSSQRSRPIRRVILQTRPSVSRNSNDEPIHRIKRQQRAFPVGPVPRPGSLSRPTIRVPPSTQEQQLRQRNDVLTRVFEEEEQQKSQRNEVTDQQPVAGDKNVKEPLGLSSGALALLGNVQSSFSCTGRPYGYYADVENSCRIFHICLPIVDPLGASNAAETLQWSFFCGAGTVFDQSTLTCVHSDDAAQCSEAESLYETVNGAFGQRSGAENRLRR